MRLIVMAGLSRPLAPCFLPTDVDARDKRAHDRDDWNLRAYTLIGLSCFRGAMKQRMTVFCDRISAQRTLTSRCPHLPCARYDDYSRQQTISARPADETELIRPAAVSPFLPHRSELLAIRRPTLRLAVDGRIGPGCARKPRHHLW